MTHRKVILITLFLTIISFDSYSQIDTLELVTTYYSPIPDPRAFEFDGTNFWLANLTRPILYKLDINTNKVDSIITPFNRIAGITFHDGEMWVVRDTVLGLSPVISITTGDTLYYNQIYCVYRISPDNGTILDSIRYEASGGGTHNFLWGIAYHKSNIYVSFDGGWGACTYKLYPMNKDSLDKLIGAHPSGMTVIGDERWGVGVGMVFNGNLLATLGENGSETYEYKLRFDVSDITFDGEHIWLCNNKKSSLCKMEKITTSVKVQSVFLSEDFSVNRVNDRVIITHPLIDASFTLSVYTLDGRKIDAFTYTNGKDLVWNTEPISNSLYLLNISNGTEQYRQRVFINE